MRFLSSIALIVAFTALHGQGREKILNTDSGRVVLHYFTNGKLSTKEWTDNDDRWGHSWAYDHTGKELINYQTRRIAGHASVHFSYHPNGAISKAEISDAPDGGIQWYRSTTTFDENGTQTGFTEQGHDNYGPIPGPGVHVVTRPEVKQPQQEVVEEQHLFVNEVLVVNSTKWACVITATTKEPSPALTGGTYTLQPGDTLRIGAFSMGEVFDDPAKHVTLLAQRPNGKGKKRSPMELLLLQQKQASPEHRKYFYHALPEGTRLKVLR